MNQDVYQFFESASPYFFIWLSIFLAVTIFQIGLKLKRTSYQLNEGMVLGELPGLPLLILHSVCFFYALFLMDWISAIVFAWWGPGFIYVAYLMLTKRRREPIDWGKYATPISLACKINYLVLVAIFFFYQLYGAIFSYSIWIMHDQIKLSWFEGNADRTRRLTEDFWIFRIAYPAFLFLPFFVSNFPLNTFSCLLGGVIFILWVIGMVRLISQKGFYKKPSTTENLRDIVYTPKK